MQWLTRRKRFPTDVWYDTDITVLWHALFSVLIISWRRYHAVFYIHKTCNQRTKPKQQTVIIYFKQRQQDTCAFSSLDQTVPKNIHHSWFKGTTLCATSDRNEKVWPFHLPIFQHCTQEMVHFLVTVFHVRFDTDILNTSFPAATRRCFHHNMTYDITCGSFVIICAKWTEWMTDIPFSFDVCHCARNGSKTVKATNFKFDKHVSKDSPDSPDTTP